MLNLSLNSFFRDVPLFAALDAVQLSELLQQVEPFVRGPGTRLFEQGTISNGMYVLERGEVGVYVCPPSGERVLLAEIGGGALIGELSLIDGAPRSATVETISETSGYFLSRERFQKLRDKGAGGAALLVLELARVLEQRKRVAEARLHALVDDDAGPLTPELAQLFGRLLKG